MKSFQKFFDGRAGEQTALFYYVCLCCLDMVMYAIRCDLL